MISRFVLTGKNTFQKTFVFDQRTTRTEFWEFAVFNSFVMAIMSLIDYYLFPDVDDFGIFLGIYSLLIIIPFLALGIRRLHDVGKSGWNILWLNFLSSLIAGIIASGVVAWAEARTDKPPVPFADAIFFLTMFTIFLISCLPWLLIGKGDETANTYGIPPKDYPHKKTGGSFFKTEKTNIDDLPNKEKIEVLEKHIKDLKVEELEKELKDLKEK
jgi:uncharacterized membrane protein YhaH (DUF805 family)